MFGGEAVTKVLDREVAGRHETAENDNGDQDGLHDRGCSITHVTHSS